MPQYGNIGLFYGGEVTKDLATNALIVNGFLIRTVAGMFGISAEANAARRIRVSFNQPEQSFDISRLDDFSLPVYELKVPATAGEAFIVFNSTIRDLQVAPAVNSTMTVIQRLAWPDGAAGVSDITLDDGPRQISRVADTVDPIRPSEYYHNGMDFSDARFNQPLVSFGVMGNVLQGENRARLGSSYAYSTLKTDDIGVSVNTVTLGRFEVFIRERHGEQDRYRHVDTQIPTTLDFANFAADWTNCTIHLGMHPETGEILRDKNIVPRVALEDGSVTDAIHLAYAIVPAVATKLEDYPFVVVSDSTGNNLQTGTEVFAQNLAHPSGFVEPLMVETHTDPNSLRVAENGFYLRGLLAKLKAQVLDLGAAPVSGDRLDFLYVKVRRVLYPNVPQDGTFYTQLAGSGYSVLEATIEIQEGVVTNRPEEILTNPVASGGLGYQPSAEGDGSYYKLDNTSFGGTSWALPFMLVSRFSQEAYSLATPWGGTGRPDGKRHDRIGADEMELCAPVVRLNSGVADAKILGETMDAILRGQPTQMARGGVAGYSSPYSKHPLQVDAIAGAPIPGAAMLTPPNGLRRQWTAMPRPYWLSTSFEVKGDLLTGDYSNDLVLYDQDARELKILMPTGTVIDLQGAAGGVPELSLKWSHNGADVIIEPVLQEDGVTAVPFVVASDLKSVSMKLSNAPDTGFPEASQVLRVVVAIKVISIRDTHLKETPTALLMGELNEAPIVVANEQLAVDYVPAPSGTLLVSPIGETDKGEASVLLLRQTIAADTRVVTVAGSYDGHDVLGVRFADLLNERMVPVKTFAVQSQRFVGGNLEVTFFDTLLAGSVIEINVSLAGSVINVRPDVNGIHEFGRAQMVTGQASGSDTSYVVLRAPAVPGGEFSVLLGAFTYINDNVDATSAFGVYVDGQIYPALVSGFNTHMMTVRLAISASDYAAATNQASWQPAAGGTYVLAQGVAFQVACLLSAALEVSDELRLTYLSSALGFTPVVGDEEFEIVHRGYVVSTSDSIANQSDSRLSPVSERFPITRGQLFAPDIMPVTSVRDAALSFEQNGILPLEGTRFRIDGEISMGIFIGTPQSGIAVWFALVRIGRDLRVFTYVVDNGGLLVNNPARAFLSRPLTPYVI